MERNFVKEIINDTTSVNDIKILFAEVFIVKKAKWCLAFLLLKNPKQCLGKEIYYVVGLSKNSYIILAKGYIFGYITATLE